MREQKATMEKLVNLCKGRGIIYPGSEIYGGMGNTWDYGPVGVEIKNNINRAWWKKFVQESENSFGVDAAILMNARVWDASGHTASFSDPKMDCRECKTRHRADTLIENHSKGAVNPDTMTNEEMEQYIREHKVCCPKCGKSNFTPIRQFNMMFETSRGVTEEGQNKIYLRPETAQGEFVNFLNVQRTTRARVPFGIAQVGKAFRNEITPGNFTFRTREFEQMELEFFCKPGTDMEWFEYWKQYAQDFLKNLGMNMENIRIRDHEKEELSHYSNATSDLEYLFPFGWGELWGIADRTDFDLMQHQNHSGQDMSYMDPETHEKYVPYCIEPSLGADRVALAFLIDAYDEETLTDAKGKEDTRIVLRLHPALAPYKVAVLPLSNKLKEQAEPIYEELSKYFSTDYDTSGSIGKRYRRQDEIGTPFCVCVDFDTAEDHCVTIRDRDTMEQIRLPLSDVREYINSKLEF